MMSAPKPLRLLRPALLLAALALAFGSNQARANDLSGCWTGHWQSCTTGHKGPLTATFCKVDDDRYQVTFRGRFFGIIPFRYRVTLRVVSEEGNQVTLAGNAYLGKRYGTFTYRASASATNFIAHYDSCRDDGKFVLCRRLSCCADH